MKAIQLSENKELAWVDLPTPHAGVGEVRVNLKASALNHRELWIQKGLYPGMKLPCILGADGAGIIDEVGADGNVALLGKEVILYPAYEWGASEHASSKQFRVLGMPDPGTMAAYIVVPESSIVIKPSYLSMEAAAALPIAGLTAFRALTVNGKIKKGDKVLITGIGGGVAQAGLSFCPHFEAAVYVTSSSQAKIDEAIKLGAKGGVNYKDEDWFAQLKAFSGGIDIVLDSSPAPVLDNYLAFLNMGARIVYYGSTGSRSTTIKNMSKFFLRHISFIGSTMGSPNDFFNMIAFMEQHQIQPLIHETFDMKDAVSAFASLAEGKHSGKIVLRH